MKSARSAKSADQFVDPAVRSEQALADFGAPHPPEGLLPQLLQTPDFRPPAQVSRLIEDEPPSSMIHEPLRMALAEVPAGSRQSVSRSVGPEISPAQTSPPLQQPHRQLQDERLEQIPPELQTTPQPTLPRAMDESVSSAPIETVHRQDDPEVADAPEVQEIDLDQLAEDVLPLVKRILEIESERIPR
jgi:hypothetical protein